MATSAVEGLSSLGTASVAPLCTYLSVAALTDRAAKCDKGERLYYVLKALAQIGDDSAVVPALRMYAELDQFIATTDNPNYAANLQRHLQSLVNFVKKLDAFATASIPATVGDQRAEARAAVDKILAQYQ